MRAPRVYYLIAGLLAALVLVLYRDHLCVLACRAGINVETKRTFSHQPVATRTAFAAGTGKRVLVTGGAGFLGSHLVDRLMQAGDRVMVVDSFYTGRRGNVAQWLHHPRFQLLEHDVTRPLHVDAVEEIYHLACPASPPVYMADPVFTINTNTLGTHNMLELARRTGAKILLASTSEVYGDPQVVPQTEEYRGYVNPVGRRSSYDEGKRAAEAMVISYHKQYNMSVRIARISNSYGPRLPADGGGVVGSFIKQALRNEPIYIYGEGNQTRCLQYVSDAVEGLVRLMEVPYSQPINIAGTERFTVADLARRVLEAIPDSRSQIVKKPPREDDPQLRRPDVTRAAILLKWTPTVSLSEGLKPTILYFQEQLKDNASLDWI